MPVVIVETWPLKKEQKKDLICKLTDAFVSQGVPSQAVTVIFHDSPLENWGGGGEHHCEKFKDLQR
ncbi:tautomerase family protein [Candidatus Woesearchaeota archaeon]|nr:tautomerase family protein [Candidatus Woesearchaeota archaeon]